MEKSSKSMMPEISKERVAMWRQMNPVGRDRIRLLPGELPVGGLSPL